ncbi:MAG TPA: MXAN_5187 C-terminal domain-containing protein [Myxococcales bacterium]|nr:MXAN_5187 C-terminal domain-containing protein [Myxococcales bacterium]
MSRLRLWTFTAVVGLALAANLVLLSLHVVQAAEEGLRARLAAASSGLKAQLALLDARIAPRGLAQNAELLEALRPPDPSVPAARPDERALRAAVAVLSPEPDLLVVANGAGAVVSGRGKPAALEDLAALGPLRPLADAAAGKPGFVEVDKQLYRVAAARAPGGAGVVLTGTLIDDRLAQQLRSLLDADVAFFNGPSLSATSLPAGSRRDDLSRWQKARGPAPGYGKLEVRLPLVGHRFDGQLPIGPLGVSVGVAERGALLPLDGGVQAAVTVPAGPSLAWFARYQVFYAVGLALLFLFGLVWALLPGRKQGVQSAASRKPSPDRPKLPPTEEREPEVGPVRRRPRSVERGDSSVSSVASLLGADVSPPGEVSPGKLGSTEVPWSPAFEERSHWSPPAPGAKPARANGPAPESLDPEMAPQSAGGHEIRSRGANAAAQSADSSADPEWASAAGASAPPAASDPAEEPGPWSDQGPAGAHEEGGGGFEQAATIPGTPREELLAQARGGGREEAEGAFPGNEPTRIQPISAALLEKLREKDDAQVPSAFGEGADSAAADPDEAHFKETFEQFVALRKQTGEGSGNVSYEKFAARLRKNREDLLAKHGARGVRFAVYLKEGKAAIKASTTR